MSQNWQQQQQQQPPAGGGFRRNNSSNPPQYYGSAPTYSSHQQQQQQQPPAGGGYRGNNSSNPPQHYRSAATYSSHQQQQQQQPPAGGGFRGNNSSNPPQHYGSAPTFSSYQQNNSGASFNSSNRSYPNNRSRPYELDKEDETRLSRQLSSILRHRAQDMKIDMDSGGFVYVDDIMKLGSFKGATPETIQRIVKNDNKERFLLKTEEATNRLVVRANQGHSIQLENLELKEIRDPLEYPNVLHGTYYENWNKIRTQGLKTMQRNHIHFACDLPGSSGVISGMRQSCEIIIYLDIAKAIKDGIKFYLSSNNVILSSGNDKNVIGPEYFLRASDWFKPGIDLCTIAPVETVGTTSSVISERVASREGMKTDVGKSKQYPLGYTPVGKSQNYPPGYNPVDEGSSEKTNSKGKNKKNKKKKQSMDSNGKGETQGHTGEQGTKKIKVSEKQERHNFEESLQEVKSQKPKNEGETKNKNKKNEKNIERESSDSKEKGNPVEEEHNTVQSEIEEMKLQNFQPRLEEKFLKLDTIAVTVQNRMVAAGNLEQLIIFDRNSTKDIAFLQSVMNNRRITKLIFPANIQNINTLDTKKFKNVLDISILYNEMNGKSANPDLYELYKIIRETPSKSKDEIPLTSEHSEITSNQKRTALFVWQTFEIYRSYEERLNKQIEDRICKLSFEKLNPDKGEKN